MPDTGRGSLGDKSPGVLSDSTIRKLRSVLAGQLSSGDEPSEELKRLLKDITREARSRNLRAEQLVIEFKNVWNSLLEASPSRDPEADEQARSRLISLCIEAYYIE